MIKEIDGDLIKLALEGNFDVICHGVNCFCTMGAGIAPQMAKAFGCDKFYYEDKDYKGSINKLGIIDYQTGLVNDKGKFEWSRSNNIFDGMLAVVNAYTQYKYGRNHADGDDKPFDYDAFTLCMRKINHIFKGKHIGLPKIGAGLGGGDWTLIRGIIVIELKDMDVTIVNYKK